MKMRVELLKINHPERIVKNHVYTVASEFILSMAKNPGIIDST